MKMKHGVRIDDEEKYPQRPRNIDLLRDTIDSMRRTSKKHERDFKAFDKAAIPKEFLQLCWNYKVEIEQLLHQYEMIDGSSYVSTKVGKPEKADAKKIALKFVQDYQKSAGDETKYPSYMALFEAVNRALGSFVLKGDIPEVSDRTCSDWLTQMRRGNFKIEADQDLLDF